MDITSVIEAVFRLVIILLTTFVIPWIKAKTDEKNLAKAVKLAEIAVAAAEQIYDATAKEEKRHYVGEFLAYRGLKIDEGIIDALIEASVLELHNAIKE